MLERDKHDAFACEIFAVVGSQLLTRTRNVATTVQPHHDRPFLVVVNARRPDIDPQAIFTGDAIVPTEHPGLLIVLPAMTFRLGTYAAVLHGAAFRGPRLRLARRHKAARATGIVAVRDALEGEDAIANVTA